VCFLHLDYVAGPSDVPYLHCTSNPLLLHDFCRSVEFVEERRDALDRYLQALLAHEQLQRECLGQRGAGVDAFGEPHCSLGLSKPFNTDKKQPGHPIKPRHGSELRCPPIPLPQTAPTCTSSCGPAHSCMSWRRCSRSRC